MQKLHYLKGYLAGEPEQLLRQPITAANDQKCWQTLTKRYDNRRYLSNCILKRLMNQPVAKESSSSVKELLDTTVDCLHSLSNLGIDTKSWDVIIIYIISDKLDSESRKLWEAEVSSVEHLPTFDKFKSFLESRFRSLEYLDTAKSTQKSTVVKSKNLHVVSSDSGTTVLTCPFCTQDHSLSHCKQFCKEDYETRSEFVRTHRLCYNCLSSNHSIKFCGVKTTCQLCQRKHHSLLHPKVSSRSTSPTTSGLSGEAAAVRTATSALPTASSTAQESDLPTQPTHFSRRVVPNRVLLPTALVEAQTKSGHKQILRALLDQGSQTSFITESAVQLLGLKKIPTRSVISGIGGDKSAFASKFIVSVTIQSRHDPTVSIQVQAYVMRTITKLIPSTRILIQTWPQLKDLVLADPEYHTPSKIDILFGAEVYGQVIKEGLVKCGSGPIIAQNTSLGWILSGQPHADRNVDAAQPHKTLVSMCSQVSDNHLFKKVWETIDLTKLKSISTGLEKRPVPKYVREHLTTNKDNSLWVKYSSLQRLIRVIAYCRRFLRQKEHRESYLTSEELSDALEIYIRKYQAQEFKEDINSIKKLGIVSKKSKLRPLCPWIDNKGILKVGGRIQKSKMTESMIHIQS